MSTLIRGGRDAVSVSVDERGVRIALGPDGISASVTLDFGEARLLAESILDGLEALLEVVLEVAASRDDVSLPRVLADGVWRVVRDDDQVSFEKLSRRERDLMLCANPMLWPLGDRLPLKRWRPSPPPAPKAMPGRMETGFLRRDRGPSIWDGPDVVASFESFEDLLDAGWRVD